jgi:hypothetical protein
LPPHHTQPAPVLLAIFLEVINRTVHDFKEADEHFTVLTSTTILSLASINPRDKHLGAGNISLIPLRWK